MGKSIFHLHFRMPGTFRLYRIERVSSLDVLFSSTGFIGLPSPTVFLTSVPSLSALSYVSIEYSKFEHRSITNLYYVDLPGVERTHLSALKNTRETEKLLYQTLAMNKFR